MRLLIDIGNSRLKWAWRAKRGSEIVVAGALDNETVTAVLLAEVWSKQKQVESVWVSSVANSKVLLKVQKAVDKLWEVKFHIAKMQSNACSIRNDYQTLDRLGVDRWLAAIGAREFVAKGDLIIVDAGTAVTVDWLSKDNVYQGGAIIPGLQLMHDALVDKAFGIDSQIAKIDIVIGKSTRDCVNSGVYYGHIGAVERVITEIRQQNKMKGSVILTGGGAETLSGELTMKTQLNPGLVFYGLDKVAQCAC